MKSENILEFEESIRKLENAAHTLLVCSVGTSYHDNEFSADTLSGMLAFISSGIETEVNKLNQIRGQLQEEVTADEN